MSKLQTNIIKDSKYKVGGGRVFLFIKRTFLILGMYGFLMLETIAPLYGSINIATVYREGGTNVIRSNNSIEVVNIARVDENGVSYNQYENFDVGKEGAILNNSHTLVDTKLAGWILGNNNLEPNKEAKLILNEVKSKKSELYGYIEVAGKRADVIIANTNGIVCDGCGFLNVNNATLSTGKVNFGENGAFSGLHVQQGAVEIGRGGLNALQGNRLSIIAKQLKLYGEIRAKDIEVSLGKQTFDLGGGVYSSSEDTDIGYAISSSEFGGIYGNAITLVSSGENIGVKVDFNMVSQGGKISVDAEGNLSIHKNVDSKVELSIKGKSVDISTQAELIGRGVVSLEAKTSIKSAGNISGNSVIIGSQNLMLEGGNIRSQSDLQINTRELNINGIEELSSKKVLLEALNVAVGVSSKVKAEESIRIKSKSANLLGSIVSGGQIVIDSVDKLDVGGRISSVGDMEITSNIINLRATEINSKGNVRVVGGDIDINNSSIYSRSDFDIRGNFLNFAGNFYSIGDTSIMSKNKIIFAGKLTSDGGISLLGSKVDIISGSELNSQKDLQIKGSAIVVKDSKFYGGDRVFVEGKDFNAHGSRIYAEGNIGIKFRDKIDLSAEIGGKKDILIATEIFNIHEDSKISGVGYIKVEAKDIFAGAGSTLRANGGLDIQGERLNSYGDIYSVGESKLILQDSLFSKGSITGGSIEIKTGSLNIEGGEINVKDKIVIEATNVLVGREAKVYGGISNIVRSGSVRLHGDFNATGKIDLLLRSNFDLTSKLWGEGIINIVAESININGSGNVKGNGVAITSNKLQIEDKGQISSNKDINIIANDLIVGDSTTIKANNALILRGTKLEMLGSAYAGSGAHISYSEAKIDGLMAGDGDLVIDSSNIHMKSDISFKGKVNLKAIGAIEITEGSSIYSGSDLFLRGSSLYFGGKTYSAGLDGVNIEISEEVNLVSGSAIGAFANMKLTAKGINVENGASVSAGGDLKIGGNGLNIAEGATLYAKADIIFIGNYVDIYGSLYAGNILSLNLANNFIVRRGSNVGADNQVTIAAKDITVDASARLISGGKMQIDGNSLKIGNGNNYYAENNLYTIVGAKGDLSLNIAGDIIVQAKSNLTSNGILNINTDKLYNRGFVAANSINFALSELHNLGGERIGNSRDSYLNSGAIFANDNILIASRDGGESEGIYNISASIESLHGDIRVESKAFRNTVAWWEFKEYIGEWQTESYVEINRWKEDRTNYMIEHYIMRLIKTKVIDYDVYGARAAEIRAGGNININANMVENTSSAISSGKAVNINATIFSNNTLLKTKYKEQYVEDQFYKNSDYNDCDPWGDCKWVVEYRDKPMGNNSRTKEIEYVNNVVYDASILGAGDVSINASESFNSGDSRGGVTYSSSGSSLGRVESGFSGAVDNILYGKNSFPRVEEGVAKPEGDKFYQVINGKEFFFEGNRFYPIINKPRLESILEGNKFYPADRTNQYRIDRNSYFRDLNNFKSSKYFLDYIGLGGSKFFSDRYVDLRVVEAQVRDRVGEGYGSRTEQLEGLIEAGIKEMEKQGLTIGYPLTEEQIGKLERPIIWWTHQKIGGQFVLVPTVYFPKSSKGVYGSKAKSNSVIHVEGRLPGYKQASIRKEDLIPYTFNIAQDLNINYVKIKPTPINLLPLNPYNHTNKK